ncbi:MAG: hypothetical protein KF730_08075 [Sphingomonas sp.]|uniref:hypothetical protein n=1 Tax=Sphingomonas sp. TaxID=28214 RepID=UPI0025EB82EE|nr:hypothetical protein [Sphingomonas sp.]MBX3564517.1 hypothetical protein [Sphingomonas sp.]
MLLSPAADKPFTADQWAECAQIALFRSESASGDAQDDLIGEASNYFDKAGALLFPGKELGDEEYEALSQKGQARLAEQVALSKQMGAVKYANLALTVCRLEIQRS